MSTKTRMSLAIVALLNAAMCAFNVYVFAASGHYAYLAYAVVSAAVAVWVASAATS